MYKTIAIDGACRRNGQPDCISSGACFVLDTTADVEQGYVYSVHEEHSTSQRGELHGLQLAIEHVHASPVETVVITDSEYLFNSMTKEWVSRWLCNGWKTAQGDPVKNQDIWQEVWPVYEQVKDLITFYHIKGHLLSVGAKKYHEIMYQDTSGYSLYRWAVEHQELKVNKIKHALDLSEANNGFRPELDLLHSFAAMNLVADAVANLCLETLEAEQWQSFLKNGLQTATVPV